MTMHGAGLIWLAPSNSSLRRRLTTDNCPPINECHGQDRIEGKSTFIQVYLGQYLRRCMTSCSVTRPGGRFNSCLLVSAFVYLFLFRQLKGLISTEASGFGTIISAGKEFNAFNILFFICIRFLTHYPLNHIVRISWKGFGCRQKM